MADDDCIPTAQTLTTPEAIAGCKSATHDMRIEAGRRWAQDNLIFTADDCEHDMPGRPDRVDFVNGCQEYVRQTSYRFIGMDWAAQNVIEDAAACHGRIRHATPEFEQGCEEAVQPLLKIRNDGQRWARVHHVSVEADCIKSDSPEFKQHLYFVAGCQDMARMVRDCAQDPANAMCCKVAQPPSCH